MNNSHLPPKLNNNIKGTKIYSLTPIARASTFIVFEFKLNDIELVTAFCPMGIWVKNDLLTQFVNNLIFDLKNGK